MHHGLIMWLIIGGIAGFLAGKLTRGSGYGVLADIALGLAGAFVGGWLFGLVGIGPGHGLVGSTVTATVGAVALVMATRAITG